MSKFKAGDAVVVVKAGTIKDKTLAKGLVGKVVSASADPKFAYARVVFASLGADPIVVPHDWLDKS